MPKATRKIVEQELSDWAQLGVDGHFDAATPWYSYHETLREPSRGWWRAA
jgi:kynureninase